MEHEFFIVPFKQHSNRKNCFCQWQTDRKKEKKSELNQLNLEQDFRHKSKLFKFENKLFVN